MSPADNILERLQKVQLTKPQSWKACCPAHADKNPSLNITEAEDGRVLVKCWAGCTTENILAAVGLEMRDLFPDSGTNKRPGRRAVSRKALLHEGMICRIGEALLASGEVLAADDMARYELARKRLRVSR